MGRLGPTGCVLALTAVALSGMGAPMHANAPARVAIRIVSSAGVDDGIVAAMFRELVATWMRDDVDVLLYRQAVNPPPVATVSLIVSREWPPAALSSSLGWIRLVTQRDVDAGTVPIPILTVSVAATRALVDATVYRGGPIFQRPWDLRRELLARALGRIAAHELGHYLLASRQHASQGLMRARFRPDDLVSEDRSTFCLEPAERRTLEARLQDARFLLAEKQE